MGVSLPPDERTYVTILEKWGWASPHYKMRIPFEGGEASALLHSNGRLEYVTEAIRTVDIWKALPTSLSWLVQLECCFSRSPFVNLHAFKSNLESGVVPPTSNT